MQVWIAEKPSQAADIARVLGGVRRGDNYFDTNQGRVVFASGHLLAQVDPEAYNPEWKAWSLDHLPLVPPKFRLQPADAKRRKLLSVVVAALKGASNVIIATDPDREGESIAREIIDASGYRGPIQRLWMKGLDDASLRKALANLRPNAETLPLYWSSQARSRADWIWGLSLTRLATLLVQARGGRGVRNIGRVQTPTLALVVRRDLEIENFVSRNYFELAARVRAAGQYVVLRFAPSASPEDRRLYDRAQAEALQARAQGAQAPLQVSTERKRQGPPPLFSLRGLQKACSAQFGWTADHTLSIAQSLYETHKATSYPRTDCPFLPMEQAAEIGSVLKALESAAPLAGVVAQLATPLVRKSVWDTSKVTAHHAIIPTMQPADLDALSADERKAYLLIARHYLAALMPDAEYDETRIRMDCNGIPFSAVGKVPRVPGWKAAFGAEPCGDEDESDARSPLPVIANGTPGVAESVDLEMKKTQPPPRYTEGTLIEDMASIGKFATDPKIKAILKGTEGIGTEATRASTIKELRGKRFLEAKGRAIISTALGRELIASQPAVVSDAAMTAVWEERLQAIASGQLPEAARDEFVHQVGENVRKIVAFMRARAATEPAPETAAATDGPPTDKMLQAAKFAANQLGHKVLPPGAETSFNACKAYLDAALQGVRDRAETGRPTERAVEFATRLAAQHHCLVPPAALLDRSALSRFIDDLQGSK